MRRTIHAEAAYRGGCSIQNGKSCGKSVPKRVLKLISNYFLQLPATVGMLIVGGSGMRWTRDLRSGLGGGRSAGRDEYEGSDRG